MYLSYVFHTHLGTDLETEVQIQMEYTWIHDDTPKYTEYIQNTDKIRILDTIHAKYTKIRIEGKVSHLGGKTEPLPPRPLRASPNPADAAHAAYAPTQPIHRRSTEPPTTTI